jgi:hypothetical protein
VRLVAGLVLAALAACSQAAEPQAQETAAAIVATPAAPAKSAAEALITRYTWPGPKDPRQSHPKQGGPYAPRDDCGALDGAWEFRLALAEAVLAKDADALVALASPDIKLDFGGGEGHAELRRRLADAGWAIWPALEAVLPLGCAVNSQGGLTLPWYFAQETPTPDPFAAMIVLGEDVPLLAAPRGDAKALAMLSWDVVSLDPELDSELSEYARVSTLNGKTGWVPEDRLRSYIDYRLVAERGANGWQIRSFVAGD